VRLTIRFEIGGLTATFLTQRILKRRRRRRKKKCWIGEILTKLLVKLAENPREIGV